MRSIPINVILPQTRLSGSSDGSPCEMLKENTETVSTLNYGENEIAPDCQWEENEADAFGLSEIDPAAVTPDRSQRNHGTESVSDKSQTQEIMSLVYHVIYSSVYSVPMLLVQGQGKCGKGRSIEPRQTHGSCHTKDEEKLSGYNSRAHSNTEVDDGEIGLDSGWCSPEVILQAIRLRHRHRLAQSERLTETQDKSPGHLNHVSSGEDDESTSNVCLMDDCLPLNRVDLGGPLGGIDPTGLSGLGATESESTSNESSTPWATLVEHPALGVLLLGLHPCQTAQLFASLGEQTYSGENSPGKQIVEQRRGCLQRDSEGCTYLATWLNAASRVFACPSVPSFIASGRPSSSSSSPP